MAGWGLRSTMAALFMSATWGMGAQAAPDHVKIGVLTDLTGPYTKTL